MDLTPTFRLMSAGYSEEQLNYHYTKDRAVLLLALQTASEGGGKAVARTWLASLIEVFLTFALPVMLVLLAIYASGKRLPGKPGDDMRLHSLAK
jgi:hypothetical protein